jgi:hypothetical protein
MIYGKRKNGKEHGTVFTKREIVDFIIALCEKEGQQLNNSVIIDPSTGDGAFILPIIDNILSKEKGDIRSFLNNIYAIELDSSKIEQFKINIDNYFKEKNLPYSNKDINILIGDYLTIKLPKADIIIGNPPYVRYDNIPADKRLSYKKIYSSFTNRSDIYIPFIEKSLRLLKTNGVLSFICADRWVNNQYGKFLRKLIYYNYDLKYFFKFGKYNPFLELVIAYPSIFLIKNSSNSNRILFKTIDNANELDIEKLNASKEIYTFNSSYNINYDNDSHSLKFMEDMGFKIGIGVATGADKVFILDNNSEIENDLLVPLLTRKDIINDNICWNHRYLVNTYNPKGRGLVDLNKYPKLSKYLEFHKDQLLNRHVARKNISHWYKLIDSVNIELISRPKLLIPDISTKPIIIYDEGHFYPHHNFYYITSNDRTDLLVLRSILMSNFVIEQIMKKGITMNGGALRWQAQTLRKLIIPDIIEFDHDIKQKLITYYESADFISINSVVDKIIKLQSPSSTMAQAI